MPGHKLLIVDDMEDLRQDLVRIAQARLPACEIHQAGNEHEAARLIARNRFSVVVTDIGLEQAGGTEEGGFAILDLVKEHDPDTQVIVVTSRPTSAQLKRIEAMPGCAFLERLSAVFHELFYKHLREALRRADELRSSTLSIYVPDRGTGRIQFHLDTNTLQCTATDLSLDFPVLKESIAGVGCLVEPGMRRQQSALARLIGRMLWDRLFADHPEVLTALRQAEGPQRRPVSIRIVSANDALDIPFEFLFDGKEFLALRHPLVRVLRDVNSQRPASASGLAETPLRVLLLAADTCSGDLLSIPGVDDEVDAIRDVLASFAFRVKPVIRKSWECTAQAARELLDQPWHVIHFAGHGIYQESQPGNSQLLFWERPGHQDCWPLIRDNPSAAQKLRGRLEAVTAGDLAYPSGELPPALVYLSCCHSARSGDPYCLAYSKSLGLADAVVRSGVPIVVGHRWPLIDGDGSVRFVRTFYQRLLSQYPPEQALLWARKSVADDDPTWTSSVMVMQTV